MNRLKNGIVLGVALFLLVCAVETRAQGFFYMEVPKDGRIYVFNNMKAYQEFQQTGDIEKKLVRVGAGPNGETMVFDGAEAIQLYNFKHNLPGEVIKEAEPAPAPALQEKLPYRFSGLMFGDYFYNVQRDAAIATLPNVATGGVKSFNGFQFRRIYLTFDDDLSDRFTTRFRLEADQISLTSNGKIGVFVKDAYLQWKNVFKNNDFIFGLQPTPYFDTPESAWAFRSLEKTPIDLRGIVPTRDIGVSLKGKFDSPGKYSYWVTVGNNSATSPEIDKFKRFYFHFKYKPTDKLQFTAYEDIKQNAKLADPNHAGSTLGDNTLTTAFFAGYGVKDKYSLGFDTFFSTTKNGNKIGAIAPFEISNRTATGYSAFAWYQWTPQLGVVGRFDHFDPNKDSAFKGDARQLYIASFFVKPHKNIFIMPNVEIEKYEDSPSGQSYKSSVTARLTFYYIYP